MEVFINNNPPPAHSKKHAIPNLLALDPLAPFEFSFPSHDQEFWWDDSSDFSNCEEDLDIAAPYNIMTSPVVTAIQSMSSNTISPSPEIDFHSRILSAISKNAPKNMYRRKKSAMKRRRNRRIRKLVAAKTADIDPHFRSIFSNVGDLFIPKSPHTEFECNQQKHAKTF